MVPSLVFQLVAGPLIDHAAGEAAGEEAQCPNCDVEAGKITARLGPAIFPVYFVGMALVLLGSFALVPALAALLFEADSINTDEFVLGGAIAGAGLIAGVLITRFAWARAPRSSRFQLKCRACGHRWDKTRLRTYNGVRAPVTLFNLLWVLLIAAGCAVLIILDVE